MRPTKLVLTAALSTLPGTSAFAAGGTSSAARRAPAAFVPAAHRPSASVFAPQTAAVRAYSSAALGMANVHKLSDPMEEMLNGVDVFIFDCDGVIWRGDSLIDGIPRYPGQAQGLGEEDVLRYQQLHQVPRRIQEEVRLPLASTFPPRPFSAPLFAAAAYLELTKFKESGKKV